LDSSRENRAQPLRTPPGPGALVQASIDPVVAIGTLAAVVAFFGARFDGACLILALLVFTMTFPGTLARDTGSAGDLALDIATGWAAIVALLLFLGWSSRTLGSFDDRVILAWALATPAALFAVHRALPRLWPRLLAA
jgi:putative colanic acid biosynthesis UDP-glucose lipid carrier transferase